ncbi:hypothetical protein PHLCEN_2v5690 [Hermanssonia centrifuga]|uniref:Uncharacterized protein n=1 Tax=Hermanssonia centrifuga TaxID=98765 RepID=A0A2R6P1P8_9APHY|nr:hypothetical protein PHLCEN_2v5690 [Hermanssonia centrifuga]
MATIPLPPGLSLDQYLTLQGQLVTIAITVAVAMAVIGWDYMVLLPEEIALYMNFDKKLWRTPTAWLFVALRYSAFIATVPSLFFTSVQNQHCQAAVVISTLGGVLVVASSGLIFCYRVFAFWHENRIVYGTVLLFYAGMLGCWIAVAVHYKAITGPTTPFGSNCQMEPIVSWAPISYASSVVFDSVVLALTLAKVHSSSMPRSNLGEQISRDNIAYFTLATATNIAVLSIQALGSAHDMIKPAAVPFSTVMTVAMGSRVYLNLKLYDKKQQNRVSSFPLTPPISPGFSHFSRDRASQSPQIIPTPLGSFAQTAYDDKSTLA